MAFIYPSVPVSTIDYDFQIFIKRDLTNKKWSMMMLAPGGTQTRIEWNSLRDQVEVLECIQAIIEKQFGEQS